MTTELDLWHLDQTINDRGVQIDLELAEAAVRAVDRAQASLALQAQELTYGAVTAATQRDALLAHIKDAYGLTFDDLRGSTVERILESSTLPPELRELLQVRLQASTTSTAKYKTLLAGTSADSRLRGTLQFCGASRTGRWAGRLFQPQNLPRPNLENDEILAGIDALKADAEDLVTDNVMELTSSAIRGCIVAPDGYKLVVSDLSNIEGRVQAWLAGETWKLAAFRAYDTIIGVDAKGKPIRKGHDLYCLAYAKSFGIRPEDVSKDQRQVGKVQELALGYQGGVGAFVTFAAAYGISLDELAERAWDAIPGDILEQSIGALAWTKEQKRPRHGLPDRAWIVCESFKRSWREAHPQIAAYWRELEDAARAAIQQPGKVFHARKLKVSRLGAWLRIQLPSGRFLCYPSPAISEDNKLTYMGINQYSRKWERLTTYGGKLFENVCQAVARDVLAYNMPAIEAEGYDIVLTVHDEIITETPDVPDFTVDALSQLMATPPSWARDIPLASAGFQAYRYKKD